MMSSAAEQAARAMGIDPLKLAALLPGEAWSVGAPDEGLPNLEHLGEFTWIGAGDPVTVLVGVSDGEVAVAVPIVTWRGQSPVIGVAREDRHPKGRDLERWLAYAVATAQREREATYGRCPRCGRVMPPEWMLDDELCQSCAEADGVVF